MNRTATGAVPPCGMPEHFETVHAPPYQHLTAHRIRDAFGDERVRTAQHAGLAAMRRVRPGPSGHVVRDSDGRDLGVLVRCLGVPGGAAPRQWVLVPAAGRPPLGYWDGLHEGASHLALLAAQAAVVAERERRDAQRREEKWLAQPDGPLDPFDEEALAGLTTG